MATRLSLAEYIVEIDCWRGGGRSKRRGWREMYKLEMLLRIWKEKKQSTYCINVLKTVLTQEVIVNNMFWIWL